MTEQAASDDNLALEKEGGRTAHYVLVTSYPFPYIGATANRVRALADALACRPGARVTVVGPGPDVDADSVDWDSFRYAIRSKPEGAYSKRNLFQRAFRELRQTWRLLSEARRSEPDVLMVTSPSVFLLSVAVLERSRPVVIDLRDLVWEYFLARSGFGSLAGRLLRRFSLSCLRRAHAITVTNEHEAESLQSQGFEKPVMVRNGIDAERFDVLQGIAKEGVGQSSDSLHVVYIGNVGLAQGLATLVRAASTRGDVRVTIVGGGADFGRVQELVDELGAGNVELTGPLPWDRALSYYREADVLYAQLGEAYKTAVPSKLFEYLATGKRVIFGGPEGSAVSLMRNFNGVSLVPPDDVESLQSAIKSLINEPMAEPLWDNVRKVGNDHLRESQATRFADLLERLALS